MAGLLKAQPRQSHPVTSPLFPKTPQLDTDFHLYQVVSYIIYGK